MTTPVCGLALILGGTALLVTVAATSANVGRMRQALLGRRAALQARESEPGVALLAGRAHPVDRNLFRLHQETFAIRLEVARRRAGQLQVAGSARAEDLSCDIAMLVGLNEALLRSVRGRPTRSQVDVARSLATGLDNLIHGCSHRAAGGAAAMPPRYQVPTEAHVS